MCYSQSIDSAGYATLLTPLNRLESASLVTEMRDAMKHIEALSVTGEKLPQSLVEIWSELRDIYLATRSVFLSRFFEVD